MSANGRLLQSELRPVQGSILLRTDAAAAYQRWHAEAAREGTGIGIAAPFGGYRTLADQRYMLDHPALFPGKSLSAAGSSPHGDGDAVDIVGDLHWAVRTATRFGFHRNVSGDLNHFQYVPPQHPELPHPAEKEETDMKPILLEITNRDRSTQWALVSPDLSRFVPIWKVDTANRLSTVFGTLTAVSKDEWNAFRMAADLPADPTVG